MKTGPKSRRKKWGGQTLIEVLLALFMLTVAVTILAATMPVANRSTVKADFVGKAAGLAQKELESIRNLGYANLSGTVLASNGLLDSATQSAANTYTFTNIDLGVVDSIATIMPAGAGTVMIEQVNIDLRRITITVSWTERGTRRNFVLGTLVANL